MRHPALIFDFGNVLAFFDYARACEGFGRRLGLSGPEFLERLRSAGFADWVKRYEAGAIGCREFSAATARLAGLEIGHDEFAAAWGDIFTLNEPVARLASELREAGYRLVLGSNTNKIHADHFRPRFADALAAFDRLVLSFEVGAIKPSASFYHACADAAGCPRDECLFIDDLPENVEGARAAGLQGLLFRDADQLRHDLGARGILAGP